MLGPWPLGPRESALIVVLGLVLVLAVPMLIIVDIILNLLGIGDI